MRWCQAGRQKRSVGAILSRMSWEASWRRWDLSEAPEEAKTEHAKFCWQRRGMCKGPEVGAGQEHLRNIREASVEGRE